MKHLGLFEGIGGFSLAARWAGWKTIAWCEWNEFGQKVLKHNFPEAEGHGDIKKTDFTKYNGTIDIITGGFPCQPYSQAGKRKGKEDERHLWPEMLRAIREVQPSYIVGENVRGLTNWNGGLVFDEVQADLESEGFEVLPFLLPACAINAPHRRDRIWFVAYSSSNGHKLRRFRQNRLEEGESISKQEEWERLRSDIRGVNEQGDVANSIGIGCNNRSNNRQERYIQTNIGTSKENKSERNGWERGAGAFSSVTANSTGSGSKGQYISGPGEGELRGLNSKNDVTNSNSRRQSSEEYRQEESGWHSKESVSSYWENFPTQSPICGGDDGLPTELDGITFPKWRNESIKAYGNAIVPQVAYEIFKAINNYEKNRYNM